MTRQDSKAFGRIRQDDHLLFCHVILNVSGNFWQSKKLAASVQKRVQALTRYLRNAHARSEWRISWPQLPRRSDLPTRTQNDCARRIQHEIVLVNTTRAEASLRSFQCGISDPTTSRFMPSMKERRNFLTKRC